MSYDLIYDVFMLSYLIFFNYSDFHWMLKNQKNTHKLGHYTIQDMGSMHFF